MSPRRITRSAVASAVALVTLTSIGAAACPRPGHDPARERATLHSTVERTQAAASRGHIRVRPPAPALPPAAPAPVATTEPLEPPAPPTAEPVPEPTVAPDPGGSGSVNHPTGPAPEVAAEPTPSSATAFGVPDGAALSPRPGGTVETSGEIADVVFDSDVVFTGSDLTLRNVRVNGEAIIRGDRVQVTSSEFGALAISGAQGVTVTGVEVYGLAGRDGIHITSDSGTVRDVVIRDTLVHDPKVTAGSHYDGIQVRGVDGLTLERVRIELGPWVPQHNAALFLENANGGNRNVTLTGSVLSGGGYTLYSFADTVTISDTVLDHGKWGILYPSSRTGGLVRFSGNTDAAGRGVQLRAGSIS